MKHFDSWWERKNNTIMVIPDVKRPGPKYFDIHEFTNIELAYNRHLEYLKTGSFGGDVIPDMSSYLGPGSLCTFIGAEPIHSEKTIWYKEGCTDSDCLLKNCSQFLKGNSEDFQWYNWSLNATEYYSINSNLEFMPSMPDLQQNLDIVAAVMGADRLFMEMMDEPEKIMELLRILHLVWEKAFMAHWERIVDNDGYSAYTHYNIAGKGKTSVLQSDISCMMSCEMFDEFELPFLKEQCKSLDNVIYHLDGPGALRHLDSILTINKINAIQWVPGAGTPGNAHDSWHYIYDKIVKSGKGLYVFLMPDEIHEFVEKYGDGRILIRTLVDTPDEQKRLVDKFAN